MNRRVSAKEGVSAYTSFQQRRRAQALERQKNARQDKLQELRSLAQAATQVEDESMQEDTQQERQQQVASSTVGSGRQQQLPQDTQLFGTDGMEPSQLSGAAMKTYYARQLMQPEWMSDIPPDLAASWLVMPRPEGKRCLVIATGNYTYARSRTGALLCRFPSRLPGGGPHSCSGGPSCYCVLDCILQEGEQTAQQQQDQLMDADMGAPGDSNGAMQAGDNSSNGQMPSRTFFIQDVLAWRGYSLIDCGAEFRLYWLVSKLAEETAGLPGGGSSSWCLDGGEPGPGHAHRFKLLPYWRATAAGLAAAASAGATAAVTASTCSSSPSYVQDGIYLKHVEGHYSQGGVCTPLALLWKDESCSRYLLDTDGAGIVPQYQQVVLVYQGMPSAGVATADEPPVVLGRLPQEFVQQMGTKLRAGRLLRFSIKDGGIIFNSDGSPAGADLGYEGPANQRRGRADLISKILFQWQARRQPLSLQALLAAAAAGEQQHNSSMKI